MPNHNHRGDALRRSGQADDIHMTGSRKSGLSGIFDKTGYIENRKTAYAIKGSDWLKTYMRGKNGGTAGDI